MKIIAKILDLCCYLCYICTRNNAIITKNHRTMKTNAEKNQMIMKQMELAKAMYFAKYPNNGKTVKSYWNKCRLMAAREVGFCV